MQTKSIIIKKNDSFIIYKELKSNLYIMSINSLLIIHLKQKYFEDFEFLYKDTNYSFNVYSNGKHYYIVCVSKYKDQSFNYTEWLMANDCSRNYLLLSKVYDAFLIMNKYKYCKCNYIFIKNIGKGSVSLEINNLIKYYINFINNSYLPYYKMNF